MNRKDRKVFMQGWQEGWDDALHKLKAVAERDIARGVEQIPLKSLLIVLEEMLDPYDGPPRRIVGVDADGRWLYDCLECGGKKTTTGFGGRDIPCGACAVQP